MALLYSVWYALLKKNEKKAIANCMIAQQLARILKLYILSSQA